MPKLKASGFYHKFFMDTIIAALIGAAASIAIGYFAYLGKLKDVIENTKKGGGLSAEHDSIAKEMERSSDTLTEKIKDSSLSLSEKLAGTRADVRALVDDMHEQKAYRQALSKQDADIQKSLDTLSGVMERMKEKDGLISEKDSRIALLEATVKQKDAELGLAHKTIEENEREIAELRIRLKRNRDLDEDYEL